MIEKWTTLEMQVTPKTLVGWSNRLDREMHEARLGEEVPSIEIKDYSTKTIIKLSQSRSVASKR